MMFLPFFKLLNGYDDQRVFFFVYVYELAKSFAACCHHLAPGKTNVY